MIAGLGFPMALQFKPDGQGGWLYRKDQTGAPLPATAAERDSYVRWYGWIMVSSLFVFSGIVLVFSLVATALAPDPDDTVGALGALVMGAAAFGLLYLYLRWFGHAPARAFAGRTPLGPAQTRKQVFGRRVARGSYGRFAATIGAMIVLGLVALRDQPGSWWLPFALFLPIGFGFAYWKWSIDREPG